MSKLIATGSALPRTQVSNDELVQQTGIDSSDEWIKQRTGISYRYLAQEDESLTDLASQAAQAALDQVDEDIRQQINLIIVATMSSGLPTPAIANQVQSRLGIEESWAFDVSGACSGFVSALHLAQQLMPNYDSGYSLVIGAEKMSSMVDFTDRSSCILFGDGAGAVLIENDGQGLKDYQSQLTSIPDKKEAIHYDVLQKDEGIVMAGRDVFNLVVRQVIPTLKAFIQEEVGDVDYILSHQANARLIEIIVKKMKVDPQKVPVNIDQVANTSAASIPLLLDHCVKEGMIALDGQDKVVLTGFGGGLAWGHLAFYL